MSMCVLQNIAVETAFPQGDICRLDDFSMRKNKRALSELECGTLYHNERYDGVFNSGSQSEGLAMGSGWGHPAADNDYMYLNGGLLGVYVEGGQQPRGKSCLDFRPEGCPAAYCKLEVTDISGVKKSIVYAGGKWCDNNCIDESDSRHWITTYHAVRKMKDADGFTCNDPTVVGPASQSGIYNRDIVQSLVCSGPHPKLHHEFRNRPRGSWPPLRLITYILQMPMLLVLVGHKGSPDSEFKQQARMSWSHLELKLIQELPESVLQGYIASKYVMKRFLKAHRGQKEAVDGRSRLGSYHIKTVFLHFLEKTPPLLITSPFLLFLDLVHQLDECIAVGKLPHYFVNQCNLLETVGDGERDIAHKAVRYILSNPLSALLTSPTDPQQIYGGVCPDDLVNAFRAASTHLTRDKYRNLFDLLARVDERRRHRFKEQQEDDRNKCVYGRNQLTGLADMLNEIKACDI